MATLKQQQISVLTMNTMAFAVNFAVWVMFSVIGIKIKAELNLNETEFGLLVATPILTGSLVRCRWASSPTAIGGRIVFFIQMLLVSPFRPGWSLRDGILAIPLAGAVRRAGRRLVRSRHRLHLGLVQQGAAGHGDGHFRRGQRRFLADQIRRALIIAAFGAWQMVPKVYAVAMMVMAILFWFFTYTDPLHRKCGTKPRPLRAWASSCTPLLDARVWRFGLALRFRVRRFRGAGLVVAEILRR
jgi:NNP family nitrate/nitrite transporter-like MFS transporter